MTLTQYLRVLRQHWLLVLILTILGVVLALGYTGRQTPLYSAQTQVFVSAQGPGSRTSLSQLSESSSFSQQRVKSYSNMATSSAVTEPVVKRLRLPYTPAELAGKINASPQLDTVLINISVSDPQPRRAADIATAVTGQLQSVVNELESGNATGQSTVKLTTTRQATVPTVPVSPRAPLNIALGLLLGLGLGVGAAVLRDQLNTTLRGIGDVEQLTGSVPLGVVPFDASAPKQPLVTADAFGGRAEAFRTLRTNLQFADVDNPPRVIAVTSALPDEGKTTTACNIALILAQSGARVVLVEGDLRKPAVGRYLGISNAAGLTNVLAGQHDLRDVVVGYERDLLAVLPSGPTPPNPSELLGSQQMRHLLDTLAEHYDVVIIDAPPLLPVTDAALIATAADGAILVIRHGRSRREEADRALKSLEAVSAKVLGTVLNFAPRKNGRGGGYQGYGYGYGRPALDPAGEPPARESRRERRDRREPAGTPETPSGTSITLPPAQPVPAPVPAPDGNRAGAESWAAPDLGWAPSPSDGWAPIAESSGPRVAGPESPGPNRVSASAGLSATGPRPVVTAEDPGPAVVSRAEGLEVTRTAVPEELRLQSVRPPRPAAPEPEPDRRPAPGPVATPDPPAAPSHPHSPSPSAAPKPPYEPFAPSSPDTAPSGLRIGGIAARPEASWRQDSWFDGRPGAAPATGTSWRTDDTTPRTGTARVNRPAAEAVPSDPPAPSAGGPAPTGLWRSGDPQDEAPGAPRPTGDRRGGNPLPDNVSPIHPGPGAGDSRPDENWRSGFRPGEPPDPEEIPPLLVDLSAPDLDLLEDERELLIPPQSVMPHMPTGVPRHHRSKRSL